MNDDLISRAEAIKTVKFYESFCDPYPRVIESLEKLPSVNQWIKCSDGMPRDGQWAIWVFNDGYIDVARYKFDAIAHFFPPTKSKHILEDAVAWMPMPKPYEEER